MQESIYDEFVEKSAERALKRVVGDPFNFAVDQGPQVEHLERTFLEDEDLWGIYFLLNFPNRLMKNK